MTDFEFTADLDEDGVESEWQWLGKDATIFLIDASPEMFLKLKDDEEDPPFVKALRCAHSSITRKIIGNDQDLHGIVLFNTKETKNDISFSDIYVMQDIGKPGAEKILELEVYLEDKSSSKANKSFGSTKGASMQEVLWLCRKLFIDCKSKLTTKNVLLFTCNADPHTDAHQKQLALKQAKDLAESGIYLEVLPIGSNFNFNAFYKDILTEGREEGTEEALSILSDPTDRFEELLDRVRRYEHKQRTTGRVPLTLCPGVEIGVKVFTSIRKTYKPAKAKLYKVTNEEIIKRRKETMPDGELLMPSDISKYQVYGNKKIKFTLNEIKSMSKVYEPGIEILGFKPRSEFKPFFYIKPASFIYPDEASVKGSTKVFACLLERCTNRDMWPIARVQARQNASVSWAFLLPQPEEKDEKNCQVNPPGFYICYLPFADDFRNIKMDNKIRASSEQIDAAKNILKKLHFKYHPESFENPDIQTHWRNVEALALNRSYLEPVVDYTVPDFNRIEKKAGSLIEEFKKLVFSPSYDPEAAMKKRPPPSNSSNAAPKRPKMTVPTTVEEARVSDMVDKLNMDTLKQWLITRGVRVTGKRKAQLVQDVYDTQP